VSKFHLKHRGYKLNLLSRKTTEDLCTENRRMQKQCRPLYHHGKCGGVLHASERIKKSLLLLSRYLSLVDLVLNVVSYLDEH